MNYYYFACFRSDQVHKKKWLKHHYRNHLHQEKHRRHLVSTISSTTEQLNPYPTNRSVYSTFRRQSYVNKLSNNKNVHSKQLDVIGAASEKDSEATYASHITKTMEQKTVTVTLESCSRHGGDGVQSLVDNLGSLEEDVYMPTNVEQVEVMVHQENEGSDDEVQTLGKSSDKWPSLPSKFDLELSAANDNTFTCLEMKSCPEESSAVPHYSHSEPSTGRYVKAHGTSSTGRYMTISNSNKRRRKSKGNLEKKIYTRTTSADCLEYSMPIRNSGGILWRDARDRFGSLNNLDTVSTGSNDIDGIQQPTESLTTEGSPFRKTMTAASPPPLPPRKYQSDAVTTSVRFNSYDDNLKDRQQTYDDSRNKDDWQFYRRDDVRGDIIFPDRGASGFLEGSMTLDPEI